MKFGFLYDDVRKLFSIGYNVDELRRDNSYYDLLASEARWAAIWLWPAARCPGPLVPPGPPHHGPGPQHGPHLLDRHHVRVPDAQPGYAHLHRSLLDQTCNAVVRYQERYGAAARVPWGISESAYNALDPARTTGIGPSACPTWASSAASPTTWWWPLCHPACPSIGPGRALANLRRLSSLGMEGRYGFYDPSTLPARA